MNIFFDEHREILKALIKHKVSFILIGGYAVNYYGYHRSTGDMDVWIKPDNENKELLIQALESLGFDEDGLATISQWNFTKMQKFHIGSELEPDKTEFVTHISGVQFTLADELKIVADIEGLNLPIIHINDLIENKKASGRLKDLADVEYLEKIMLLRNKDK